MTNMNNAWQQDRLTAGAPPSQAGSALRRHKGKIAASLLVLAALGGGGYFALQPHHATAAKKDAAPASALTVTVTPVEKGMVPRSLMVTGSLAARDELPIGTETAGLALSEVLVDVGDHVKQGQLLARFNDSVLRAQLQQAQASLTEAEANAAEAAANAKRADDLVKSGWMSGKDYDNRRALALSMEARVGVAKANLAFADAKLRQAELRAPSDGTITWRGAHLGAVVNGGEMFRMIRDDRIELIAELPENELALVKSGMPMTLSVEGSPDITAGTVRLVEPSVDPKTRIGKVRIDIDKRAGLLPGMFINGHVTLGQAEALVVPERAVIYIDGKPIVFAVDAGGKVEARPVTLGPRDHDRIALTAGVRQGERLALRGAAYLKDGYQVTVVDGATEAAASARSN
jgi:HlyD family secretion protein